MKGLMVQENMTIEEAIKVMEGGQHAPDREAPMLPPKVLGESKPCNHHTVDNAVPLYIAH